MARDVVDDIVDEWAALRPDLDASPIGAVGRISRLSRLIDKRLAENFQRFGIEDWMYDVLATLYRSGPPYEATPGELVRRTMVTTGAITNRVDRLVDLGFVDRRPSDTDRRSNVVRLTSAGVAKVEEVAPAHLATERDVLRSLSPSAQQALVGSLRRVLVGLGDTTEESKT
ncbi:MAG: MarR family transcriptional regulator [Actinomycetota bacterium]